VKHLDRRLTLPFEREAILREWRLHTIHKPGDRITSVIGERTASGAWVGIDEQGRALLRDGDEVLIVSAGEFVIT